MTRMPAGLPDGREPDRRRDERLDEGEEVGLQGQPATDAVRRRRHADRDREGDLALVQRHQPWRRPRGQRGIEEAAPLLARLEVEFGRRRKRERKLVDLVQRSPRRRPATAR